MKVFTKVHLRFYLFSLFVGLTISAFGSDFNDIDGRIAFGFGIIIILMSVLGAIFFRKGDE